jgi:hypothetical protein
MQREIPSNSCLDQSVRGSLGPLPAAEEISPSRPAEPLPHANPGTGEATLRLGTTARVGDCRRNRRSSRAQRAQQLCRQARSAHLFLHCTDDWGRLVIFSLSRESGLPLRRIGSPEARVQRNPSALGARRTLCDSGTLVRLTAPVWQRGFVIITVRTRHFYQSEHRIRRSVSETRSNLLVCQRVRLARILSGNSMESHHFSFFTISWVHRLPVLSAVVCVFPSTC